MWLYRRWQPVDVTKRQNQSSSVFSAEGDHGSLIAQPQDVRPDLRHFRVKDSLWRVPIVYVEGSCLQMLDNARRERAVLTKPPAAENVESRETAVTATEVYDELPLNFRPVVTPTSARPVILRHCVIADATPRFTGCR